MKLYSRRSFIALALVASAALTPLYTAPAQAKPRKPKRILVVNHTAGFRHSSVPLGADIIERLGNQKRQWVTDRASNEAEVREKITPQTLKNYDVIVFANTTGELPFSEETKTAFLEWIRSGHGFVGVHAATDTFAKWDDYVRMIGGTFDEHPWHEEVTLRVEEPKFSGVKGFVKSPNITDEIYQFAKWSRDDKTVILGIDNNSIDVSKGKREDKDYAVAWARMEGKGRVFYTSLGHREEVWNDPRFQEHLTGAIRWAAGLDKTKIKVKPAAASGSARK